MDTQHQTLEQFGVVPECSGELCFSKMPRRKFPRIEQLSECSRSTQLVLNAPDAVDAIRHFQPFHIERNPEVLCTPCSRISWLLLSKQASLWCWTKDAVDQKLQLVRSWDCRFEAESDGYFFGGGAGGAAAAFSALWRAIAYLYAVCIRLASAGVAALMAFWYSLKQPS